MTHVPTTPTSQSKISRADEAPTSSSEAWSAHDDGDAKGVLTDVESMPLLRGRWRFLGVEGRKVS